MGILRAAFEMVLQVCEGIFGLFRGRVDFRRLEEGCHRLGLEVTRRMLEVVLGELDAKLCRERDAKRLRLVHRKTRSLLTPVGEVRLARRYYVDRETGAGRFLLDEALGLEPGRRISPWLEALAIRTAVDLPYHRAAALLKELTLGNVALPPMTLWWSVQRAGEEAARVAEAEREALFERGELPPGERQVERLAVEADEVVLPARQREGEPRWIGVKLAVAYEGKVETAPGRNALLNRQVVAGVTDGETFWQQTVAEMGQCWDLSHRCSVTLGGDGAGWVKQGLEYFPGAVYRLDPYHLRRTLRKELGANHETYQEVCQAIASGEWSAVDRVLCAVERTSRGKQRERVRGLRRYLANNWEGIRSSEEAQTLGAVEGEVFHHVARRMKRHGGRWSTSGADHLSRLLAARANQQLDRYTAAATPTAEQFIALELPACVREDLRQAMEDPEAWLRASLPALRGPSASAPWVKWVLREIAHVQVPA